LEIKKQKMKKQIAISLGLALTAFSSFAQLSINRTIVQQPPYKVGDTLTVNYTVAKGTTTPRYFWLRYQHNNQALILVNNSTTFGQGAQTQTFFTNWNNYSFTPWSGGTDLYSQYNRTPWAYAANSSWNVGQLTVQRVDASIDGALATQKFILGDVSDYANIHKLDMAYAVDATGAYISPINTTSASLSISNSSVSGNTAGLTIRITYPASDASITNLKAVAYPVVNGAAVTSGQPLETKTFNAQGVATFTTLKVGDVVAVYVVPSTGQSYLNNIVTVTDAYKSFLAVSSVGLTGETNFFTYPVLEKKIGNVTIGDTAFTVDDSYYSFAYVMGQNVSANAVIPTSTSTAASLKMLSSKRSTWASGVQDNIVTISSVSQTENFAYGYVGDLDWSNSSDPAVTSVATNSANGSVGSIATNSLKGYTIKTYANSTAYSSTPNANATLSVTSSIANGKVILTTSLSQADLAGLQVIMQYDQNLLTLDNVVFDAGSSVTNFSTHKDGRLTFGSIDQIKTGRIKVGTPYKLIFTPKTNINNTSGLFYFILSDAVDSKGNKVNLIIE
jgi:hypothetical protein